MLTQRLDIRYSASEFRIRGGRLDLQINATQPFNSSNIRTTPQQFSVASSSVYLSLSMDAIRNELGFRDPITFRQRYEGLSQSKASEAIAQEVSRGNAYLNDPEGTTVALAAQSGTYEAAVELVSRPSTPPDISFTRPQPPDIDFQRGRIEVSSNPSVDIRPRATPPAIALEQRGGVLIRVVPKESSVEFLA